MLAALLIAVTLTGCHTVGACSYDLAANGWRADHDPPLELQNATNRSYDWYVNDAGDRFACPDADAQDICGNVYNIYRSTAAGYDRQELVCTT